MEILKKEHRGELVLVILLIIYLVLGFKTPEPIANIVDSLVGKIVIFLIAVWG